MDARDERSTRTHGAAAGAPAPVDIAGDMGDQASRLQAAAEREAIEAALAGRVHGTDAVEDHGPYVDPLEGTDPLDDGDEASDDPLHGGGDLATDPMLSPASLVGEGAVALDEGTSVVDDVPARFEEDGDPDVDDDLLVAVDDETAAEDLDALLDVSGPAHDPDDPEDPDGYGVPPGAV